MEREQKSRNRQRFMFGVFVFIGIILIASVGLTAFGYKSTSHEQAVETEPIISSKPAVENTEKTGNDIEIVPKQEGDIYQVLLLGIDRRSANDRGRSDAIILAQVDTETNDVQLISLMRDLRVEIPGRGMDKLNHAYAFGGGELTVETVNRYFGTNVEDYIAIDFFAFEDIVDQLGGIELEFSEEEAEYVQKHAKEVAQLRGETFNEQVEAGTQLRSGKEALAFARIRKIGNGDFERTERQREVLEVTLDKMSNASVWTMTKVAQSVFPYVDTSIGLSQGLSLLPEFLDKGNYHIEQHRLPEDGSWNSQIINGGWFMIADQAEQMEKMKEILEGNTIQESSETVNLEITQRNFTPLPN